MAHKNFSFTRFALSCAILTALSACETAPKAKPRTQPGGKPEMGVLNPAPSPGQTEAPAPEMTSPVPLPQQVSGKKVAVILGPGGAKAFAHVGVLKALQLQRVPVQKVIGLEWGAMIAALYANKGQIHEIEWKLYKMEQANLPIPTGFFTSKFGEEPAKIMDKFLNESFPKENIADTKIGFACPSKTVWTGVVAFQNKGPIRDALRRCLSFPPIFKLQGTFLAGASAAAESIAALRAEGYNVIILVNVLGTAQAVPQNLQADYMIEQILWQEVKKAIVDAGKQGVEVINANTDAYSMVDFRSKKELISIGESAGMKAGAAIVSKYGF
jgi:NTE family protein